MAAGLDRHFAKPPDLSALERSIRGGDREVAARGAEAAVAVREDP